MHGLDRFAARKAIVAQLEERGLVEKIEPYVHTVPHGDRSNVVIEPFLTDQWYVDAKTLAKPAIAAVSDGRTVFVPKNWEKTYFDWMENIQPWCISRQLWWGHQIPAWYGPDGEVFVAEDGGASAALAKERYGKATGRSPATRTCSTPGSPRRCGRSRRSAGRTRRRSSKRYYPTDVLVTGFDIIFFWVARMMMMGIALHGKEPFRDVYIHALVRDEKGAEDVEVEGQRHRPARPDRRIRRRRAPLHAVRPWRRRAATSSSRISASRATATSRPSSGTPRASPR